MNKVSDEQAKALNEFIDELRGLEAEIDKSLDEVNDKIGDLNEIVQKYNNVLRNADALCTEVVNEIQDYVGTKSDPWKEKDGTYYDDWMNDWENVDLNPLDLFEDLHMETLEHANELGELKLSLE